MALRGAVAEWLGRGLQSLVHQFESGRRLSASQGPDAPAGARPVAFSLRANADRPRLDGRTQQRRLVLDQYDPAVAELARVARGDVDINATGLRSAANCFHPRWADSADAPSREAGWIESRA